MIKKILFVLCHINIAITGLFPWFTLKLAEESLAGAIMASIASLIGCYVFIWLSERLEEDIKNSKAVNLENAPKPIPSDIEPKPERQMYIYNDRVA